MTDKKDDASTLIRECLELVGKHGSASVVTTLQRINAEPEEYLSNTMLYGMLLAYRQQKGLMHDASITKLIDSKMVSVSLTDGEIDLLLPKEELLNLGKQVIQDSKEVTKEELQDLQTLNTMLSEMRRVVLQDKEVEDSPHEFGLLLRVIKMAFEKTNEHGSSKFRVDGQALVPGETFIEKIITNLDL